MESQLQTLQQDKKERLLKELLFKVVEEQRVDVDFKIFNKYPKFLGSVYDYAFQSVREKTYMKKGITTDFLSEHFGLVPEETQKMQHEIIDQLKSMFHEEKVNDALKTYNENLQKGIPNAFHLMNKALREVEVSMEKVRGLNTDDDDAMDALHESIVAGIDYINFGDNTTEGQDILAWNELELSKGQLVAILAPTKHGKSFTLEHLHALLLKQRYKVAHASYEMPRKDFFPRLYSQLGWYPLNSFKTVAMPILNGFKDKMKKLFLPQFIQTQEDGRGDLVKIEKILDTFRPDVLILDYFFNLNESFDAISTKVARDLKTLAVMYNCLIITALNTNDEGRKTDEPPEITHIKWCKTIADDFDKIISMYSKVDPSNPSIRRTEYVSKLIRQDKWVNWRVIEDRNIGEYMLRDCWVNGVNKYQESYYTPPEMNNIPEKDGVIDYEVA